LKVDDPEEYLAAHAHQFEELYENDDDPEEYLAAHAYQYEELNNEEADESEDMVDRTCPKGFYWSGKEGLTEDNCQKCKEGCAFCTSYRVCKRCKFGWRHKNSKFLFSTCIKKGLRKEEEVVEDEELNTGAD